MNQTPIPKEELELFKQLEGIEVVFDVGARIDLDYIRLKPGIECHVFEPCPEFYAILDIQQREDNLKFHLNTFV